MVFVGYSAAFILEREREREGERESSIFSATDDERPSDQNAGQRASWVEIGKTQAGRERERERAMAGWGEGKSSVVWPV